MKFLNRLFNKKKDAPIDAPKEAIKKPVAWDPSVFKKYSGENKVGEPWTFANSRLAGGAKDIGSQTALRAYNTHKRRVKNQWVNPLQSINTGFGNAQSSFYVYQPVNYFECYALAQDALFQTVFDILSTTPLSKGWVIQGKNVNTDTISSCDIEYKIRNLNEEALRSRYVTGGCLVYMDFGKTGSDLEDPLNLSKEDMRKFKGFRRIDPINVTAIDVNTVNPSEADYMEPKKWYVIGLGSAHRSHFLKYEANIPELPMRPMCLYFGMPLTQLIKQDVANSNLASQGLANLMNRFRNLILKTDDMNYTSGSAALFRDRLEAISAIQDNFMVTPIKKEDEFIQLSTSLSGMAENVELFYRIVSAKTGIPFNKLMGKQEASFGAKDDGSSRNWYDKVRTMQESIKSNMLVQYGIVYGKKTNGVFVRFDDLKFNPLEESSDRERHENLKSSIESARTLTEMGAKREDVFEWLKSFKEFNLSDIELDEDVDNLIGYEDSEGSGEQSPFNKALNAEFKESENPRDDDGKFSETGGGGGDVEKEQKKSERPCKSCRRIRDI